MRQWGNSLAVRLPKRATERLRIKDGSEVVVAPGARQIVIRPVGRKKVALRDLVDRITPANRHAQAGFGRPRGREVW